MSHSLTWNTFNDYLQLDHRSHCTQAFDGLAFSHNKTKVTHSAVTVTHQIEGSAKPLKQHSHVWDGRIQLAMVLSLNCMLAKRTLAARGV